MTQRQRSRLRFSRRLEELHEIDAEDSGQVLDLLRSLFLPSLIIVGIAAVVSVFTWLRESLFGRASLIAGGLIVLVAAIVWWRRPGTR
jgi:hypothetical protein